VPSQLPFSASLCWLHFGLTKFLVLNSLRCLCFKSVCDNTEPLNESEAGVDLVMIVVQNNIQRKMKDLHHNKVNYNLPSVQSLGHEARNCKMGYSTSIYANAAILLLDPLHTISQ